VHDWQRQSAVEVHYLVEPVRSISLARNRAIANAKGDLIAFIDDDESPESAWLLNLFRAYKEFLADGVLGPVIPSYQGKPPLWLVKSRLCVRRSFRTGTVLANPKYMRTGNMLFDRRILDGDQAPFDPRYGLTGGEDSDFFGRMLKQGRIFVWCEEARVHEDVPPERQRRGYHIRRALIRGVNNADREPFLSVGTVKSTVAVVVYTAVLPILLFVGHHLFMKYLVKKCDHLGKILAHFGVKLIRERTF
jgi:glycosyltransferase involved in cell wall biosynthesis